MSETLYYYQMSSWLFIKRVVSIVSFKHFNFVIIGHLIEIVNPWILEIGHNTWSILLGVKGFSFSNLNVFRKQNTKDKMIVIFLPMENVLIINFRCKEYEDLERCMVILQI